MSTYVSRRLLQMIPLLFVISAVIFIIIQAAPGGPETVFLSSGRFVDMKIIEAYRHKLGLDQPVYIQYFKWLGAAVTGDMGYSYSANRPVFQMIIERLPATMELMLTGFVIAAVVAIPLGIFSAIYQYSTLDFISTALSFLGIAMPVFWFGLILQLIFSVHFGWLPTAGRETVGATSLWDPIKYLILPSIVLSLRYIAGWSQYMRSTMLSVIRSDYIRTAYAKGLSKSQTYIWHGVKKAIIPVISIMALDLAGLFSGAVITETIFAWPGIGRLFIQSMNNRDYPLLMGILLLGSFMVVFFNLFADLIYGWLDPRIKYN